MSKANKRVSQAPAPAATESQPAAPAATESQAPAAPKPVQLYTITAPKRPLTGTHFGQGNLYIHTALCDLAKANNGQVTWAQIMEECTKVNHKSFATYALKRLKVIVPVVPQPPQA
jgi:hypothetical protein